MTEEILQPFHIRFRKTLILAAFGGIYMPQLNKIISSKFYRFLFRFHTTTIQFFFTMLALQSIAAAIIYEVNITWAAMYLLQTFQTGLNAQPAIWWSWKDHSYEEICVMYDKIILPNGQQKMRTALMDKIYGGNTRKVIIYHVMAVTFTLGWFITLYFKDEKVLVFTNFIPYEQKSPDYELILTLYLYPCMFYGITYGPIVLFTLIPLCWEIVELKMLKHELSLIFFGCSKPLSIENIQTIDKRLHLWIMHHRNVLKFHQKFKEVIEPVVTFQFISVFMVMWIVAFEFAVADIPRNDKLVDFAFFGSCCFLFGIVCHQFDKLHDESIHVVSETMALNWTVLPQRIKKSLLIIVMRSQKPSDIFALKIYRMSLQSYQSILNAAYGTFNMALNLSYR